MTQSKPPPRRRRRVEPSEEKLEDRYADAAEAGDPDAQQIEDALSSSEQVDFTDPASGITVRRRALEGDPVGPGLLEDDGLAPAQPGTPLPPLAPQPVGPPPVPFPVRLTPPDDGESPDQNLWTLIRNRTDAISYNNYFRYIDAVLCKAPRAKGTLPESLKEQVRDLSFLGLDGYEVLRAATEYFLMQEVGLVVDDPARAAELGFPSSEEYTRDLQRRYDRSMDVVLPDDQDGKGRPPLTPPRTTSEFRRRNSRELPDRWLSDLRDDYLQQVGSAANPRVLPYLKLILDRLRDLPLKSGGFVPGECYGVLPSRLTGPLGLELIWNYWHEEGMVVQTHNAITNRFQNLRSTAGHDPMARLEIDPLRRLNNVLWGWIQNRPFLLSVRRRAYEYDHQYGITLLGTAAGEVTGADSRSQFIAAFHHLLHSCMILFQQMDDLTVQPDAFPVLSALREVQLVLTAGSHNQYGDLPWTARVEMLMQMWMLGRPEMREFLGGRVMVPYKEPWMDRVDAVKSMMSWTDVNVTHFRDLGTFGEQILLSIRYGSWASEIEPFTATNWARYWRPEIQGYAHAYRAVTGADLRQSVDTTMPGVLLAGRLGQAAASPVRASARAVGRTPSRAVGAGSPRALPTAGPRLPAARALQSGHELQ